MEEGFREKNLYNSWFLLVIFYNSWNNTLCCPIYENELNLKGFAESYSMYDIVAKKWNAWGYVYVFTELSLGIAFLTGFNPILTNLVTFVVMAVSIIGVLQSVLNKRKIKCACLGDVFNLPMSTITIIEDALMIGMSGIMLLTML